MITQTIQKLFFCVTDVCVCVKLEKINSLTITVCNWSVHRKYLMKGPQLPKIIPPTKPCVTDLLCNGDINFPNNKHVTGPPSNPPRPRLLRGRFGIESGNQMGSNQEIDVESMLNRPLRRGGRGGFEGEVRGGICAS